MTAAVIERAESTMDLARSYDGAHGFPHWILARTQTRARGRQGRVWMSPKGAFAATLIMKPNCPPALAAQRSFVAACALHRTLSGYVDPARLAQKWPNDVLLNGCKIAGILLEASGNGHVVDRLSIGIGVNLGHAPQDVVDAAFAPIGLADVTGKTITPEEFLNVLAQCFEDVEGKFQAGGFDAIRAEWLGHAARLGEVITARTSKDTHVGTFETVDADGNMVLLTAQGKIVIPAADVYF
ncbi:MAG: biotin--[acetyl-CoA-carboxylase] ligase [Planktomarina sp.]